MQRSLTGTALALIAITSLIACKTGQDHKASAAAEKPLASLAGTAGQLAGPVTVPGGAYELQWSCSQPVEGDTLKITLYDAAQSAENRTVARVLSVPVEGDGRSGAYSLTLVKGVYLLCPTTSGTWNITLVKRETSASL